MLDGKSSIPLTAIQNDYPEALSKLDNAQLIFNIEDTCRHSSESDPGSYGYLAKNILDAAINKK